MTGKWTNCLACYYRTISTTPRHLNVQLKNPEILPMFVCSMSHRVQYTSTPFYLEWTSFLSKEIWMFSSYFSSPKILNESMLSLTHWMWSIFNLAPSLSNLLPPTLLFYFYHEITTPLWLPNFATPQVICAPSCLTPTNHNSGRFYL